jgi:NhaP-type Na+/H+ or K+/H+ antiporter
LEFAPGSGLFVHKFGYKEVVGKTASTIFLGIAIGVVGTMLYRRLRAFVDNNDPETVVNQLHDQVERLEKRFGERSEAQAA